MPIVLRLRSLSIVVLGVLLALLCTSGASAAPTWLEPRQLEPWADTDAGGHDAAVAPDGTVIALTTQVIGEAGTAWIKAQVRPPGRDVLDEQTLHDGDSLGNASDPRVAVDGAGNAVAAWTSSRAGQGVVRAAFLRAGEVEFGPAHDVSSPGAYVADPVVAIGGGTAVVLWEAEGDALVGAVKPAGATAFTAAAHVGRGTASGVAVSPTGTATAVFGDGGAVHAATLGLSGAWVTLADVQPGAVNPQEVHVAVAPDGRATAAWIVGNSGVVPPVIWSAEQTTPGGDFGPPEQLSTPDLGAADLALAVDAQDNAVVLAAAGEGMRLWTRSSGGTFAQPPAALGRSSDSLFLPAVAFAPDGTAVAVWRERGQDGVPRMMSFSWQPGGPYGPVGVVESVPTPRDDFRGRPALGVDDQGNAAVVYQVQTDADPSDGIPSRYQYRYAAYDAAGPELRITQVPASPVAGRPAHFEAAASDRWSAASMPTWTFDNAPLVPIVSTFPGGVDQVFRSPGRYGATATSVDRVGNATSVRTPLFTVGPAPPVPRSPTPVLDAAVSATWAPHKAYTSIRSLAVRVPKAVKLAVTCKGSGCPFTRRTVTVTKAGTVSLTKDFNVTRNVSVKGRKGRRAVKVVAKLKPHAVVRITVVSATARGRSWSATIQKGGKRPKLVRACLVVGKTVGAIACA